jgi:hypothetical protein
MIFRPYFLIYAIAGVLFASALAFSYYSIVLDVTTEEIEEQEFDFRAENTQDIEDNEWIYKLKTSTPKEYAYPVSEIEINLQEKKPGIDERFYKVVIDELDGYKFFCVNQVLSRNNINYSFYKEQGLVRLVVASPDYRSLKKVMDAVKEYGIEYKIED